METGMRAVFDTNILIDYLKGIPQAAAEVERYEEKWISVITFMEVLAGVETPEEAVVVRRFLAAFKTMDLNTAVSERAVHLCREKKLKLPDAIVYASARELGCALLTRNTKDFKAEWPDTREPYRL